VVHETAEGTFCGVIDFGDPCGGRPGHMTSPPCGSCCRKAPPTAFMRTYRPTLDTATMRRAAAGRWHVPSATPASTVAGGKPTWGPPAHAALQRLIATIR
jgi:hypothetical protein